MKSVYHIENGLNKLSDGRVNPTYNKAQVITLVLLGFLLRIKSFNELNLMIKNNEFSKLFRRGHSCHWSMLLEIHSRSLILKA